jgi:hypothetical protein
MSGERQPAGQHRPARRRSIAIRALLTQREYIKVTAYLLPRQSKIQVLELMERLRRERRARNPATADAPPAALPEMTGAELVREINWRVGTLPPSDAEAVTRYIRRLTRWRATRRGRDGSDGSGPGPFARRTTR